MDKQREKRSTNWTEAEKVATVHLILDNEERLFGKFRGASCGAKEKERIWQGIADELNSTGKTAVHRSVDEIKTMYKNMKSRAKDKHAQRKKTGGGPQVTMTAAEEVMLDHLLSHNPEQMEGVKGGVDSSSDLTTKTTVGTSAVPTKEPTKEPTGDYQSNQWMTTWDACAAKGTVGTDYFEVTMPESPETKGHLPHTPITSPSSMTAGSVPGLREAGRPMSNNNAGEHSPVSTTMMNGRTPSPPSSQASSNQQLPPACGARQLSKLKRFLTTLQQFGSDISPEIGERVRTLVLGLVNSHVSIEEFHGKLQEATNFPLRPFVIPFLKANLPLLQRELMHCARMAKQSPHQYLQKNDHILFNTNMQVMDSQEPSKEFPPIQINENGKRLSPDRNRENGVEHPAKRHQTLSPHSQVSPNGVLNLTNGPIRLEDISLQRELREREKLERERVEKERIERDSRDFDRERHFPPYNFNRPESGFDHLDRFDDNWRHVETMLNCIIGMVDKTRRALAVLQERSMRDHDELSMWMRRNGENDGDLKKRGPESYNNMRNAEERITEVRRRAEEAVQEVKRQAMLELHKAVAAAETKASDMVTQERSKMERAMEDIRKRTRDELIGTINHQEESSESCWNCGRKASETCSGCNTARYCGSFCQHKDWENHHHVCGKAQMSSLTQLSRETLRENPPQTVAMAPRESSPHINTPSPVNSVKSAASRSSTPETLPTDTRIAEVSR